MSIESTPSQVVGGKNPPHNLNAERSTLGGLFIKPAAMDAVSLLLVVDDFFLPAHREVYEAMLELAKTGQAPDVVAVADRLRVKGKMARLDGGESYLMHLANVVPTAENIAYYAGLVRKKSVLRKLISACAEIQTRAHGDHGDFGEFIAEAQAQIAEIDPGLSGGPVRIGDALVDAVEHIEDKVRNPGGYQVAWGLKEVDEKFGGIFGGQLVVLAQRPGLGKTALALNTMVRMSISGVPTLIFSLEMLKQELIERKLSFVSQIEGRAIARGALNFGDWKRIGAASNVLSPLQLYIDDREDLNAEQICSQARIWCAKMDDEFREKRDHDRRAAAARGEVVPENEKDRKKIQKVVVIDSASLLVLGEEGTNRAADVSKISAMLKKLAKSLGCPIILIVHLNREIEKAAKPRKPKISDLRECVSGETIVTDAETGRRVRVRDLIDAPRIVMNGLSPQMKIRSTPCVDVWSTGVKQVMVVRTRTGRILRATANHPVRTAFGWKNVGDLHAGDRIAVERFVPEPTSPRSILRDEARMIGYLISDGSYGRHRSVEYVKGEHVLVEDVERIAMSRFGIKAAPKKCQGSARQVMLCVPGCGPGGNPLIEWLKGLGIHGQIGPSKRVPTVVFESDNEVVAEFLGALWAGDGSVVKRNGRRGYVLRFSSTSMGLLIDVQHLLSRLGVISIIGVAGFNSKSTIPIAVISITSRNAVLDFAAKIKIPGEKGKKLLLAAQEAGVMGENSRIDRLPLGVTEIVKGLKESAGLSWVELGYRCQGKEMSPRDLFAVAERVKSAPLAELAAADVFWDEVLEVSDGGLEEVFDLRLPETGNFVANGIVTHNSGSLEQNADVIIFPYREPGQAGASTGPVPASLIYGKNRNGATGEVSVSWDGRFMAFYDADDDPI